MRDIPNVLVRYHFWEKAKRPENVDATTYENCIGCSGCGGCGCGA